MCPRAGALGGTAAPRLAWGTEQGRAQSPSEMPGAGGSRRVWPLLALSPRLERGQEWGCSPWLLQSLLRCPLPILTPASWADRSGPGRAVTALAGACHTLGSARAPRPRTRALTRAQDCAR